MSRPPDRFYEFLRGRNRSMSLLEAALEIAALDHADVDRAFVARSLDNWAARVLALAQAGCSGAQFLAAMQSVLFGEQGLRGDTADYYNPLNSCVDRVIERRRGLPITLSVIYLELARRLNRPVHGVALPAHFVCKYNDGLAEVFIDVFHEGRLLMRDDCLNMIERLTGQRPGTEFMLFEPATDAEIALRMLNNLQAAYLKQGRPDRAALIAEVKRYAG
jgi:regulator of sirC expression with transglutaminase-like and TPR domain